ncbi:MAG: hypothetical protein GX146_01860, partial [Myxococcales bacterium]|nr:hypothetical protein [Myxococcales bacterium]
MKQARILWAWGISIFVLLSLAMAGCDEGGSGHGNNFGPDTGDTPTDTGSTPFDTGSTPFDTGSTPFDTGSTPTDTGSTPFDTGSTPFDTGDISDSDTVDTSDPDTGTTPVDTDPVVIDTGSVDEGDPDIALAPLLQPFDANQEDLTAVDEWAPRYGKTPEIIAAVHGSELHVLAQDYDDETEWNAVLLHIKFNGERYQITQAITGFP